MTRRGCVHDRVWNPSDPLDGTREFGEVWPGPTRATGTWRCGRRAGLTAGAVALPALGVHALVDPPARWRRRGG
jgi:hypothetical protein